VSLCCFRDCDSVYAAAISFYGCPRPILDHSIIHNCRASEEGAVHGRELVAPCIGDTNFSFTSAGDDGSGIMLLPTVIHRNPLDITNTLFLSTVGATTICNRGTRIMNLDTSLFVNTSNQRWSGGGW
jgi:hypothetical protein